MTLEVGQGDFPQGSTLGVDPDAIEIGRIPGFSPIQGRAENLPIRSNSQPKVVSNSALEFTELSESIPEIVRVLQPKGTASLKTVLFHPDELQEIRTILGAQPIENVNLKVTKLHPEDRELFESGQGSEQGIVQPIQISFRKR